MEITDLPFRYLSRVMESKTLFRDWDLDQEQKKGRFRWKGPHFSAFVRYVLKLSSYCNHVRFSDRLRKLERLSYLYCEGEINPYAARQQPESFEVLEAMASFLPELGEFFVVPTVHQLLSDATTMRNDVVGAFIDFLVEAVEEFLGQKFLSPFITARIDLLLQDLKFLLLTLWDTPFQSTQAEETDKLLAEIESTANKAGLFLHYFFFTTHIIKESKIAAAISVLLPKFKMTKEKIKKRGTTFLNLPSVTTPTGDARQGRMAISFKYLLEIVESKALFLHLDQGRKKGGFRWKGPHFSVFIRYVLNLGFYCNHERFINLLRRVEKSAFICCKAKKSSRQHINLAKFLEMMDSFLPELGEFFAVSRPHTFLFGTPPKTNELVAAFIDFLVEAVEELSGQKFLSPFITTQISPLLQDLKFLLFILGDTPFQCTEVEETKNILAEIESIVNQAGLFLHSSFFTTDLVKDRKIAAAISDLLPNFKMTKRKINKHCIAFSNLPSVTTPNTALVSLFIVDSVIDYLNHLTNNEARLIAEVKDQITTLCEELYLSQSFLGDIEEKQDEDLIKQAAQLRDLACEIEYILTWFVAGEVPVWYIILRLSSFIEKNKLIRTAIPKTKLYYSVMGSPHQVLPQVSQSTHIDEEIIVGLNEETIKLASQLCGGPNDLQMISITGMPGLGKTTLAKKLYNHSSIVKHFDQRMWCVVSQTYRRTRLLIDILCSITNLKEDEFLDKEDSELGDYLHKSLKKRRYLIVMDDIWDIQAWSDVSIYFPKDDTRSKVLFTTRNTLASDAIINELRLQSPHECWDLLQQKVFQKSICPPELEHIGKQIAASCKGLPLIVVGIGAVLANMDRNKTSWQQVLESLNSYISKDQDVLELSYKHLPIHLKPCFLYFSSFAEDREILVKELLSLWISEGFIRQNKGKRSKEIAEEYLIELINRNMVQVAKRRSDKGVKACRVHDLLHDMALRIAEQEKFLKVIHDGFSLYEQHHRLCNHSNSRDIESRLFGLHIRSLLGISMSSFNVSRLRLVRVLQCRDSKDHKQTLLVQLKYLEIPYIWFQMSRRIKNLEFLIVTEKTDIGPEFSKMPKLRHLEFKRQSRFTENMKFSQNDCLETLSGVELNNLFDEEILRCFPNLRRLKCYYDHYLNECPDVSFLTHLESLSMILYTPKVKFRAINFATNIKKLSICGGSYETMSSVGKMPDLEILKLEFFDFEGENWNTNDDEFQKLKYLKLRILTLENWSTSEGHFPMLERLVLENCEHLKGIPLEFGYIPTLQMIEVHSCGKSLEESALEIQKTQQEECGNEVMQVIINGSTRS